MLDDPQACTHVHTAELFHFQQGWSWWTWLTLSHCHKAEPVLCPLFWGLKMPPFVDFLGTSSSLLWCVHWWHTRDRCFVLYVVLWCARTCNATRHKKGQSMALSRAIIFARFDDDGDVHRQLFAHPTGSRTWWRNEWLSPLSRGTGYTWSTSEARPSRALWRPAPRPCASDADMHAYQYNSHYTDVCEHITPASIHIQLDCVVHHNQKWW